MFAAIMLQYQHLSMVVKLKEEIHAATSNSRQS